MPCFFGPRIFLNCFALELNVLKDRNCRIALLPCMPSVVVFSCWALQCKDSPPTLAGMASKLYRLQILVGIDFKQSVPTVVHEVRRYI